MDRSRQWFLVGDYNMVEVGSDHKGGLGRIIEGQEKQAWTRFAQKLSLEDTIKYKKHTYTIHGTIKRSIAMIL